MSPELYSRVKELLSKDKLSDAFKLLSANYIQLKKLEQSQTQPLDEIFRRRSNLTHQLLLYIKDLYENSLEEEAFKSTIPTLDDVAVLKENGKFADAINALKEILKKDFNENAANELGLLYLNTGNLNEALLIFQSILDKNPQSHRALNNIGVTYARMGNFKKSLHYENRAYHIQPDVFYLKNITIGLTTLKDYNVIIDLITQHFAKHGEDAELYHIRSKTYLAFEKPNLQAAFDDINRAISLRPQEAEYYHLKAVIYSKDKQDENALKEAERAIYFSTDPFYKVYYGAFLLDLQRYKEALVALSQALVLHQDHSRLYLLRGHCYTYLYTSENESYLDYARQDFEKALTLNPRECEAYEMLSKIYSYWKYYSHAESYKQKGEECRMQIY
ncbi:MAG: tetratricopeptide repeat protein [Saprospiraceae bacterium]|nr:tetratricopeptide repeat protein [Saprospiraceae bacterium]